MLLTEKRELVPVDGAEADGVIHDGAEDDWGQQARWELGEDLCPEIGADSVHIVVCFSQENWSLVWEDQNDVLDGVEAHRHSDEEQCAVPVLNSGDVLSNIHEKNDAEECGQNCDDQLDIACLGQPHDVQEVPLGQ